MLIRCITSRYIFNLNTISYCYRRNLHLDLPIFQKFIPYLKLKRVSTFYYHSSPSCHKINKMGDQDAAITGEVVKTASQLKKDAKRLAKMEKFAKKKEQQMTQKSANEEKPKAKKEKATKQIITYNINTPPGEKKDITCPLPDVYSPNYVESTWYQWWEKKGFFKPEYGRTSAHEKNDKGQFVIVIPPPNVTGTLHLGHALTNAIEDSVSRWHRMNGRTTVWVPGCDHAGIATQVVVERMLKKEKNLSRHDLGREKFVEMIWDWKNKKGDRIYHQLRRLGVSVDWDRVSFTMDPKLSIAVTEAFIRMHEKKLIYRSNRLVNWSCALNSAISDIEVDKKEVTGKTEMNVPGYTQKIQFGVLHYFTYAVEDSDEKITVATTRIETMLGDTGIAVHPADERYKHLIGKNAVHPFCKRLLRIVGDDVVDPAFGTGAVKITPAHDHNDYETGKRNKLPCVTMMDENGLIRDVGDFKQQYKRFINMKRFVARYEVLHELTELNMFVKTEDNAMVIPMCSRSKDILEPLLKPQWYVNCQDMAAKAVQSVRGGDLKITPPMHEKTWYHWMENCRDWCISRQLWWGHRIPAYYVTVQGSPSGSDDDDKYWVSGRTEEEAIKKAAARFNVPVEKIFLRQDEDVLDTWFSSGLFPFSVFGWPDKNNDLQTFYPNTLLETGHDILFFWVARMVMMGQELTGTLPFKEVYLHAMIRDAYGRKMSKSLGNIIDPIDVMTGISLPDLTERLSEYNLDPKEYDKAMKGQKDMYPLGIPECGTDALRFALCAYTTQQGRDINLDVLRIQGYRHFCNKLWNAIRFAMRNFTPDFVPEENINKVCDNACPMDQWILSRLSAAIVASNEGFKAYDFSKSTTALYNFWLYDLCDVYLEAIKPVFLGENEAQKTCCLNVLYTCLDAGLRLMSPFMPFLTEELYQRLPHRKEGCPESICVASYPTESHWSRPDLDKEVEQMMEVVRTIRSMKEEYLKSMKARTPVYIKYHQDGTKDMLIKLKAVITTLSQSSEMHLLSSKEVSPSGCGVQFVGDKCEVLLSLKGIVDFKNEVDKLKIKQVETTQQLNKIIENTNIEGYSTKVPEKVQQQNTEKIAQLTTELEKMKMTLRTFEKAAMEDLFS